MTLDGVENKKNRPLCRFYEPKYPEVDEIVMVEINSITEMGVYVSVVEYNNIEGVILLSELSRRRIRSLSKLIKVGRIEPASVLRVDKDKGYIDLSKRRVSTEDASQCDERYQKSKIVYWIMSRVASALQLDLEGLYYKITWPLTEIYGHALEAFRLMALKPDEVLAKLEEKLEEPLRSTLLNTVMRITISQPFKGSAVLELSCFQYDGVLAIEESMKVAKDVSTELVHVNIKLLAAPIYVLTMTTLDKRYGLVILERAIQACKKTIESHKGRILIKKAPHIITTEDNHISADEDDDYGAKLV
jgi:translation initiation factor 2 subunit 1